MAEFAGADSEFIVALNALMELEVEVEGLSRERVMDLYHDMVAGGEEDYHYEDEADLDEDPDIDLNNLTIGGDITSVVDQISPQYHGPASVSREADGDVPEANVSDALSVEEMTARITNVCSVLCCPEEDAALFLKKFRWSELDAISGYLETGGVLNEAPTINTALDFAEDDKVRTPDAAMTRQLIPDRPMHGAATKRQTRVAREEDRAEPGAEWLFSLPEGYPNCEEMLSQARKYALLSKKWLLVNIQSDKEFSCHKMNQESWPDDTVRAVLENSYVFWQRGVKSPAGQNFLTLYNVCDDADAKSSLFPALFFVDPRTGAAVKSITGRGLIDASDLVSILFEFTEAHPISSWDDASAGLPAPPTDAESDRKPAEDETTASGSRPTTPPETDKLLPDYGDVNDEPDASNGSACRIAVKFRDGKSLVRRFLTTDPVKEVFAFAASVETTPFDIRQVAPPVYLSEYLDRSIEDMKLAGSKVVICPAQNK